MRSDVNERAVDSDDRSVGSEKYMRIFNGIAVSPGVAIGDAHVIDREGFRITRRFIDPERITDELRRLDLAIETVAGQLLDCSQDVAAHLGEQYGAIFTAQREMLLDPAVGSEAAGLIEDRNYSAEFATSRVLRRFYKVFQELEHRHLAERSQDIVDIEKRLLRELLQQRDAKQSENSSGIVLAHNLTPGETAKLNPDRVLGLACEAGGAGGHTAIVAEALEIPAVVGLGGFLSEIAAGDSVIVDGDSGQLILNPDNDTLERLEAQREHDWSETERLASLRDIAAETLDGERITLLSNIEFPREVATSRERGADGVGLYRTEFLYLGRDQEPMEGEHYEAYAEVVSQIGEGRPVVIRTLDLGADKMGLNPRSEDEKNPFLGLRSIRLSLRNLPSFRTQLRAILRASVLGEVRVMFPLISTLSELRQAKSVMLDVMDDLEAEQIEFDRNLKIGMMVEVPAAAMQIDRFAQEVDFLSIGTNDLVQYTLAVDRSNRDVAALYNAADPAVLQLIQRIVEAGNRQGISTSLCGQMSASPLFTMVLIGLGLRQLSLPPIAIPEIKEICRRVNLAQCQAVAAKALELETGLEVSDYLKHELSRVKNASVANAAHPSSSP